MQEDEVSSRLDKLERQLSLWGVLSILFLLLWAAGIVMRLDASADSMKVFRVDATAIVSQEFDLVNASGHITARLASDPSNPDSPNLVLKYPNDKAAINIGIDSATGSSLALLNSKGQPRAMISESGNGPALSLFDEDDRIRIVVDALKPGPQISIYSKDRKRTVVASSN